MLIMGIKQWLAALLLLNVCFLSSGCESAQQNVKKVDDKIKEVMW